MPLLEEVFKELEKITGLEPIWDGGKYAIVNKYKLENHTWDDGRAIDVLED